MNLIFAIICFLYLGIMLFLLFGYHKVKAFNSTIFDHDLGFSILIPFRNEAENLPFLLNNLLKLDYSSTNFESILINDASEDNSVQIILEFQVANPDFPISVLNSHPKSNSPKKDALETGVKQANFDYILTTDADCILPITWLKSFHAYIEETGCELVAGPVTLQNKTHGILQIFQELDFFGLQAVSMGGFGVKKAFLCNGANLAYKKESFLKLNGFEGNNHLASGDDIFLLEKFQKAHFKIGYLKSQSAIVYTAAQAGLSQLISQRIRWVAKGSAVQNNFGKLVGILVFLMNFALVIGFFLFLFDILEPQFFFFLFLLKFNIDFITIYQAAQFFQRERILKNYFWCSFIYPIFSSFIGISSLFSGFHWKGRHFSR